MEEHLWRLHHHRYHGHFDFGFPHPEGDPLPKEPDNDAGRVTLLLLWTYQDFFEPKILSKAQAEYSYYRNLERMWKQMVGYRYLFFYNITCCNQLISRVTYFGYLEC